MAKGDEVWVTTTKSSVSVWVTNAKGQQVSRTVGGRKGARLTISPDDREYNEELMAGGSPDHNWFRNGALVQVGGEVAATSEHQIPNDDLVKMFKSESFDQDILTLNEFNARRLVSMHEEGGATVGQYQTLKDMINERWPLTSGPTKVYQELMATGTVVGGPSAGSITVR